MYSSKCKDCGQDYPSGTSCDCKDVDCVLKESRIVDYYRVNEKEFSNKDDAIRYQKELVLAKKTKEQEESMQEYKDYVKLVEYIYSFLDKRNKMHKEESICTDDREIEFKTQFAGSSIDSITINDNEIIFWYDYNSDYPQKLYKTSKKQFLLKGTTLEKELAILHEKLTIAKIETITTHISFSTKEQEMCKGENI